MIVWLLGKRGQLAGRIQLADEFPIIRLAFHFCDEQVGHALEGDRRRGSEAAVRGPGQEQGHANQEVMRGVRHRSVDSLQVASTIH